MICGLLYTVDHCNAYSFISKTNDHVLKPRENRKFNDIDRYVPLDPIPKAYSLFLQYVLLSVCGSITVLVYADQL